jgi:hypothetical protein
MKLILQTDHKSDAIGAKLLLESKGIPAFIGSERSGQLLGGIFSSTYSLWVELDHQYDDARAVLQDPDHEPKDPVSIDDYDAFKVRWQQRFDAGVRAVIRTTVLAAVLIATAVFVPRLLDL